MNEVEYLKKYYKGNMEDAIKRLNNGEAVQYIVGDVDFYGNIIKVDKRVLIPRRETEELVEKTLKLIKDDNINILDLGTGSGCIAITLKKKLNKSHVDAVDISNDALNIASENAKLNNVDINFYLGNMLEPINNKYDLIISNPPYIDYEEEVMDIVKNNEPNIALYAPNHGCYYYEKILKEAKPYLKDKFIIAFEIGYNQANIIIDMAKRYYPDCIVYKEKDLQGFDRFIFIIKNN